MRILLSSVRVVVSHALMGVRHDLHFRWLLCKRLRRWVNVFDAQLNPRRAYFALRDSLVAKP